MTNRVDDYFISIEVIVDHMVVLFIKVVINELMMINV